MMRIARLVATLALASSITFGLATFEGGGSGSGCGNGAPAPIALHGGSHSGGGSTSVSCEPVPEGTSAGNGAPRTEIVKRCPAQVAFGEGGQVGPIRPRV